METSVLTPQEYLEIGERIIDFEDGECDPDLLIHLAKDASKLYEFVGVLLSGYGVDVMRAMFPEEDK